MTCADLEPDSDGNSWVLFDMGAKLVDLTHVFIEGENRLLDIHNGEKGTDKDLKCISDNAFNNTGSPKNGTVECDTPSTIYSGRLSLVSTSQALNENLKLCEVEFYGQRKYYTYVVRRTLLHTISDSH